MNYYSPLRYPGGKRQLSGYFSKLIGANGLKGGTYIEPYAGGAGLALSLLFNNVVRRIVINDNDPAIYAFWRTVVDSPRDLCKLIDESHVTPEEWARQKEIQKDQNVGMLERGFSTFFLNRTNRSGILDGGLIGGKNQDGPYKMDARFNKEVLKKRIMKIGDLRERIIVLDLDAEDLISDHLDAYLNEPSLVYLDPPYYHQGAALYMSHYHKKDHVDLAKKVARMEMPWVVSYDNTPEIHSLYLPFRRKVFRLNHTANINRPGKEVMIFSDDLVFPDDGRLSEETFFPRRSPIVI